MTRKPCKHRFKREKKEKVYTYAIGLIGDHDRPLVITDKRFAWVSGPFTMCLEPYLPLQEFYACLGQLYRNPFYVSPVERR